jgi:hypothetical protein
MRNLLYFFLLFHTGIGAIQAGGTHSHHIHGSENEVPSSKWMFGYQLGYSHIASNNDHMPDDSGLSLGFHAMKPIEEGRFKDKIYFAAGTHITFTEEKHIGAMLGFMYEINNKTMLSIMPGIMWMKHSIAHSNMDGMNSMTNMQMNTSMNSTPAKAKWESEYGTHIEISHTVYLFDHLINPSISWMHSSSHDQYTFGLNFHF